MSNSGISESDLRSFLLAVERNADRLEMLLRNSLTSRNGENRFITLRIRALLTQLFSRVDECICASEFEKGKAVQESITRNLSSSTVLSNHFRQIFNDTETKISKVWQSWFSELKTTDYPAIDAFFLNLTNPILLPYLPAKHSASYSGPLLRLAFEYVGVVHRSVRQFSVATTPLRNNRPALQNLMMAIEGDVQKAKSRVETKWLLELPAESSPKKTDPQKPLGRIRLAESKKPEDKAKINVYEMIRQIKIANPSFGPKKLFNYYKNNKDFISEVKAAKLKFDNKMFHTAIAFNKSNPNPRK